MIYKTSISKLLPFFLNLTILSNLLDPKPSLYNLEIEILLSKRLIIDFPILNLAILLSPT